MTPSDAPPGTLPSPAADPFPLAAPHAVPVYSGTRWPALSRWWRAALARSPHARRAGAAVSGHGGHRFFPRLTKPVGEDPA